MNANPGLAYAFLYELNIRVVVEIVEYARLDLLRKLLSRRNVNLRLVRLIL